MSKIYELNEYANVPDSEDTFSERKVIVFTSPETCVKFIQEDNFYGTCFVYDKDEYEQYHDGEGFENLCDLPEAEDIFSVDSNITIEEFKDNK